MKRLIAIAAGLCLTVSVAAWWMCNPSAIANHSVGDAIDSLHHVKVYYNGSVGNVESRHTRNGYNLGLKYQCVEFVKRYYYEHYNHQMPNSYGHAKSFYSAGVADGALNTGRALTQFTNPSNSKPQVGDLLVMDGTRWNAYGHVAIVSEVGDDFIELIQQNPGPYAPARERLTLKHTSNGRWLVEQSTLLGWLRMPG